MVYLWRAVDTEGEVLDVLVQSRRNKRAALKLMRSFEEMASSQTSSSQITCGPMGPLPMISGSRTAMSVVDGETTGRRIRINRPDDENAICKASKASGQHKDFPQSTPRSTTHQVQRHLISARTNRAFRASAMQTRQEAVAVANFSDAKLSASSFQ
jgi:putative transposase